MIIGTQSRIIDTIEFLQTVQHASSAIALIGIGNNERGFCTGWLITDTLVVVPDFAIVDNNTDLSYYCRFPSSEETPLIIPATPTRPPKTENPIDERKLPLLLRLSAPARGHVLKLELRDVILNEQILIFQYPKGEFRQHMSIGRILNINERNFQYSADTEPGAGGAPIINVHGAVTGMHIGSAPQSNQQPYNANEGMLLPEIMKELGNTPEWEEIAAYHQLVGMAPKERKTRSLAATSHKREDDFLLSSALTWKINRNTLRESETAVLEPLVIDAEDEEWIMEPSERQRIIEAAGSLEKLQQFRNNSIDDDPMQAVINRILDEPQRSVEDVSEEELPYWKAAVEWFGDVIPELPSAKEVEHVLEKKRLRSRLSIVAGPDFKGRKDNLLRLHGWLAEKEPGPMVISGIGGVGKSALLAKFVLELPKEQVLFWLDFDRTDIAPDDAVSVLRSIGEQARLQIPDFAIPSFSKEHWKPQAEELGAALAAALPNAPWPAMILDGFEIAQYARRYQEIWEVLNLILKRFPSLHIIVSGRARVNDLTLNDRPCQSIHLEGLDPESARSWLYDEHVRDEAIIAEILKISKGVPLILRLAVRLLREDKNIKGPEDFPKHLNSKLVEGYLYQRILNRIVTPHLKKLAKKALVLRTVYSEMIPTLFKEYIPVDYSGSEIFDQLKREMGLVNNPSESSFVLTGEMNQLRIRPEVRAATIQLLEYEDAGMVRDIHEKALEWYKEYKHTTPPEKAELIYHALCLGKLDEAKPYWQPECIEYLRDAGDDIPTIFSTAKDWLIKQLQSRVNLLSEWEADALKRIQNVISRKHYNAISGILQEDERRSPDSKLLIYDAWSAWTAGDSQGAIDILEKAPESSGQTNWGRVIIIAAIKADNGETDAADRLLASLENETPYSTDNRPETKLLLRSARVRLNVDIESEIYVYEQLKILADKFKFAQWPLVTILSQVHVITPGLVRWLDINKYTERIIESVYCPENDNELREFRDRMLDKIYPPGPIQPDTGLPDEDSLRKLISSVLPESDEKDKLAAQIFKLVILGIKKWHLATQDLYLNDVVQSERIFKSQHPPRLSTLTSLAAFRGEPLHISNKHRALSLESIDEYFDSIKPDTEAFSYTSYKRDKLSLIEKLLLQQEGLFVNTEDIHYLLRDVKKYDEEELRNNIPWFDLYHRLLNTKFSDLRTVLLYILSPEPLDILYKSALQFPLTYEPPKI